MSRFFLFFSRRSSKFSNFIWSILLDMTYSETVFDIAENALFGMEQILETIVIICCRIQNERCRVGAHCLYKMKIAFCKVSISVVASTHIAE